MAEDSENGQPERELANATAADIPPILRPLAERNLILPPILLEAVMGFTLTGAMVSVKSDRRTLAPRRLSHFVPDMLTRLAHELGAAGLVEIEISEPRFATRGFAFVLDAETVAELAPPAPDTEKPAEPDYPDSELGQAMRSMKPMFELMMAPVLAQMEQLRQTVAVAVEAPGEQNKRGRIFADLMAEMQVERARKMLEAEQRTPEQAMAGHLKAVGQLMTTAADAGKAMAKYAPKIDAEAEGLGKVLDVLDSPRAAAIGRGFLRMLGAKDLGASVEIPTVTVEAERASKLPDLFSVVARDAG